MFFRYVKREKQKYLTFDIMQEQRENIQAIILHIKKILNLNRCCYCDMKLLSNLLINSNITKAIKQDKHDTVFSLE